MACKALLLCLAALAPAPALTGASAVTPVQKVVELLTGMVEKGKKEKHEESLQFATYKQFCDSTIASKTKAIKEANEDIEGLQSDIEKYEADAATLGKQVSANDADISTWEGNLKAATKVREIEKEDYTATFADYGESITALEEGIATLMKENHATKQSAAALAQISQGPLIPEAQKRAIYSFLAQDPETENLAVAAPEANAYEFQAQGIVDMLNGLKEKFEDEQSDLEKKEMNAQNAHEMLTADLKSQIRDATEDRTEKSEQKAEALEGAAEAKGDMAATTGTRDDDSKYTEDLSATCAQKADAFAERRKLRAEEIAAVEKAIEILSSGAVSGASEKHLPALVQ